MYDESNENFREKWRQLPILVSARLSNYYLNSIPGTYFTGVKTPS